MLKVEMLICKVPKYHKDCVWKTAPYSFPDTRYLLLKGRLTNEVKKTKIAYRILHHKLGLLTTIKLGHDGKIFVADDLVALRAFALY